MNSEREQQDGVIDVEEYGRSGKQVPHARKYRIRIDKELYEVAVDKLTGREILALAGKTPDKFILQQKIAGNVVRIEADDIVDLRKLGVERFMTIPNEVTEGDGALRRRDFALLPDDEAYLLSHDGVWDAILDSGVHRLVIRDWPITSGYSVSKVDVYVKLEAGYPQQQIDMAYFYPALERVDGRPVNGLASEDFGGRSWQRWSRHRSGANAWRIGEDNLSTHMALVADWLRSELRK